MTNMTSNMLLKQISLIWPIASETDPSFCIRWLAWQGVHVSKAWHISSMSEMPRMIGRQQKSSTMVFANVTDGTSH